MAVPAAAFFWLCVVPATRGLQSARDAQVGLTPPDVRVSSPEASAETASSQHEPAEESNTGPVSSLLQRTARVRYSGASSRPDLIVVAFMLSVVGALIATWLLSLCCYPFRARLEESLEGGFDDDFVEEDGSYGEVDLRHDAADPDDGGGSATGVSPEFPSGGGHLLGGHSVWNVCGKHSRVGKGDRKRQDKWTLGWFQWLLLFSVDILGPFSSDCYLPNAVSIKRDLNTTSLLVALTIQVNWIARAVATLVLGWLSDGYGRRAVILFGLCFYVVGAVLGGFAPRIEWLLIARAVQGVGEGVSAIPSAIVRERVQGKRSRSQMMTLLGTLRPVAVVAAPLAGGLVGAYAGWRTVIFGCAVWGVLSLAGVWIGFSEVPGSGSVPTMRPPPRVRAGLARLWANPRYVAILGMLTFAQSAISTMLVLLGFVLYDGYHLKSSLWSVLYGMVPFAGMAGSALTFFLMRPTVVDRRDAVSGQDAKENKGPSDGARPATTRVSPSPMDIVFVARGLMAAATSFMLVCALVSAARVFWGFVLVACFLLVSSFFVAYGPAWSVSLEPFPDMAGLASGVSEFSQVGVSAIVSIIVTAFYNGTARSMLLPMAVLMALGEFWFWIFMLRCWPQKSTWVRMASARAGAIDHVERAQRQRFEQRRASTGSDRVSLIDARQ